MTTPAKKFIRFVASAVMLNLFLAPMAFAAPVNCDEDNDGYVALRSNMLEEIVQDNTYQEDGNYTPEQWKTIFDTYVRNLGSRANVDDIYVCANINFKKGAEPARCDKVQIDPNSGVFDSGRVTSLAGNKVNPGAFDTPDNGIDEDCDGADGKFIAAAGSTADLGGLVGRTISLLGRAVVAVSIVVLIWGGILYATAAGDEQKTSKARKAIIGAIIGLIVGLLAPAIVSYVSGQLV